MGRLKKTFLKRKLLLEVPRLRNCLYVTALKFDLREGERSEIEFEGKVDGNGKEERAAM